MTMARRFTLVWTALMVLTFGSFALGIEQRDSFASVATVIILGVAMVKVRLIGIHFMDLRSAPRPLRLLFEGYVLVIFVVLTVISLPIGV